MATHASHGIKIKTHDSGRAEWLTPSGGLTSKKIHASLNAPDVAERVAKEIAQDNPEVVQWARAEAIHA